jgi:MFS family permease
VLSLASDYVPKGSEAMGNSLIWGLGQNGGNAAGSLLIGAIVLNDFGRLDLAFRIMAAVAVVSAFFILLVPKRVRKVIGEDQMDEGAQSLSFSGS